MAETDYSKISSDDINSGKYVFKDVFDVYRYIKSKGWNIGWYAAPQFEIMELDENNVVASPLPIQPLYRGQSSFFEKCLPSLYRRRWTNLQSLERLVQIEDFKHILQDNPEIRDNIKGGLSINYNGLAQHYGIETNIIDLTNSFGVAAFFATSDYNQLDGSYRPVMEITRKGVIYFLPMGIFGFGPASKNQIWPIGMEALVRPGEQRGFGAYLKENQDFHTLGGSRFFFWQNAEASIECHRRFGFGTVLFPYDPMVEKVWNIRKYRIYGKDSIVKVAENNPELGYDATTAIIALEEDGCNIVETTPFRYTRDEIKFITDRYHKRYPDSFPKE